MFARYWYICPRMFVTHFFRNVAVKIFDILFSSLIKSLPLSISLSISTNFTTSDLSPLSLYFSLPLPIFNFSEYTLHISIFTYLSLARKGPKKIKLTDENPLPNGIVYTNQQPFWYMYRKLYLIEWLTLTQYVMIQLNIKPLARIYFNSKIFFC